MIDVSEMEMLASDYDRVAAAIVGRNRPLADVLYVAAQNLRDAVGNVEALLDEEGVA